MFVLSDLFSSWFPTSDPILKTAYQTREQKVTQEWPLLEKQLEEKVTQAVTSGISPDAIKIALPTVPYEENQDKLRERFNQRGFQVIESWIEPRWRKEGSPYYFVDLYRVPSPLHKLSPCWWNWQGEAGYESTSRYIRESY